MQNRTPFFIVGVIIILGMGLLVYKTSRNTKSPTLSSSDITFSQIAQHNLRSSCWVAINGSVYDLTSWIPNHPGGEEVILNLCGRDGSIDYNGQHGDASKSASVLLGFKIGIIAK